MSEIRPELHLWVAYLEKKEELEEAQDRIAKLEAALLSAKQHFVADEPLKAFVEICFALRGKDE